MKLITKERMNVISEKHLRAKKDFKNRCFFLIEALVGGDIVYDNTEKLKEDIYKIAHIGTGTCENEHRDWEKEAEEMFARFEKNGLL